PHPASETKFLLDHGPGPPGLLFEPPQVLHEELLRRMGIEQIVEELVVADPSDFVTFQATQGLLADGQRRILTGLRCHQIMIPMDSMMLIDLFVSDGESMTFGSVVTHTRVVLKASGLPERPELRWLLDGVGALVRTPVE